jgi:hypothetical protein
MMRLSILYLPRVTQAEQLSGRLPTLAAALYLAEPAWLGPTEMFALAELWGYRCDLWRLRDGRPPRPPRCAAAAAAVAPCGQHGKRLAGPAALSLAAVHARIGEVLRSTPGTATEGLSAGAASASTAPAAPACASATTRPKALMPAVAEWHKVLDAWAAPLNGACCVAAGWLPAARSPALLLPGEVPRAPPGAAAAA